MWAWHLEMFTMVTTGNLPVTVAGEFIRGWTIGVAISIILYTLIRLYNIVNILFKDLFNLI